MIKNCLINNLKHINNKTMKNFINFIYLFAMGIALSIVYLISLPNTGILILSILILSFYFFALGLFLENKMYSKLFLLITMLVLIAQCMIIYNCLKLESSNNQLHNTSYVIDLPEEIESVEYTDLLRGHFNTNKDTLFIEYISGYEPNYINPE
jgi:hypothetical protein